MREVDRLGALEVRVARHRPVEMALGELDERGAQRGDPGERGVRVGAREQDEVGGDLVVARARGVELAADGADEVGQPPLDRHVDVDVVGRERERPGLELGRDLVEPAQERVALVLGDDPGRREHRRVRARLRDVMRPEPAVVADRGVELAEDRVVRLGEARHGSSIMATRRPPCARARAARAAGACRSSSAGARRSARWRPASCTARRAPRRTRRARASSTGPLTTTHAFGRSPLRSSGTPATQASATAGWLVQHRLELGGRDLEAADLDQLLEPAGERDVAVRVDAARSPVWSQPSASIVAAVAAGSSR